MVVRLIECMLVVYGADGAQVVAAVVPSLISACTKAAYDASAGGGVTECEPDVVVCGYLSVLARLAFDHPLSFAAAVHSASAASVAAASTGSPQPAQSPLQIQIAIVELWLGKFDSVGYKSGSWGNRRKAWALALCSVLPHVMSGSVGSVPGCGADAAAAAGWMLESVDEVLEVCGAVLSDLENIQQETSSEVRNVRVHLDARFEASNAAHDELKSEFAAFVEDQAARKNWPTPTESSN